MNKTLIIGAQNIDIFVHTKNDYVLHDSNSAEIRTAFGGVGCNIALNLALLGNNISFLTVFGDDTFGKLAMKNLIEYNVKIDNSLETDQTNNSIYLGIHDNKNDLYLGINDMDIVNRLNPEFFSARKEYIQQFDIMVIDNNLRYDALEFLFSTFSHKQIITDAVSAEKAVKLKKLLKYIDVLKVNHIELNTLSDKETFEEKIDDLMQTGLNQLIITNSQNDIVYKSKEEYIKTAPIKAENIMNTSGTGDAFLAGYVHGIIHNKSIKECLEIAKKTAYLTLQTQNSVNLKITPKDAE